MLFFNNRSLPCKGNKICPFEYEGGNPRDIEGMPFPQNKADWRACPYYGHICPKFLEEIGLDIEDLNTRATLHCGLTAKEMIASGNWKLEEMGEMREQIEDLLKRYEKVICDFPQDRYPKLYIWEV